MNYLNETDLIYQIRLSNGKGQPTKELERMLIKLGYKTIRVFYYNKHMEDCLQHGLLNLFKNWNKYNEIRYSKAMPYLTEIFKRGVTECYNQLENINWRKEKIITTHLPDDFYI